MLTRRSLIPAGAALAAGLGLTGARAAEDGVIVVPMRLSEERFWTQVWINHRGPYPVMLGTASNRYLISRKIVEEAGLTYAPSENLRGITGVEHAERNYAAAEVVIGGVLRDRDVVFSAAPIFRDSIVGSMPLGLLLLRPTVLDFAEGQMRIYESGAPSTSDYQRLDLSFPLEDVPQLSVGAARFKAPPRLIVPVRLDGKVYRLMLDTGGPYAVTLSATTVANQGLWNKYPRWAQSDGRGVEEAFKGRAVRLNTLEVGDVTMKDPVVHLIDPQAIDARFRADGWIGLEALRRMSLLIDAGDNSLWMKPNGAVGQAFRYNRSGMGLALHEGVLRVVRLTPESPAAHAGLAVNDIVLPPPDMTPRSFRYSLTDQPGRVLEFQAQRDGKAFPVRLVLQDLI
jgi:hypothetical protein